MGKVKNFFKKIGAWFKNHLPTKRRLIQLYTALLTNANIKGFATGRIYKGATKNMCVPGLNCYSCPGAVGACPLGALQDSLAHSGTSAPVYILGILALFGILFGRMICGFFCPTGLAQELLYKIPTPKLKKNRGTRILSYFKYILLVLVIAIPLIYEGIPFFCKYICPAGTAGGALSLLSYPGNKEYFGALGFLFSWKFMLLVCFVIASIFIYRFFCRFFCPLGALYGFFNKIALLGVKLDKSKCIECGKCVTKCKMDVKHVGDHECINCGECIPVCPTKAIGWKGSKIVLQPSLLFKKGEPAPAEEAPLSGYFKAESASMTAEAVVETPVAESRQPAFETVYVKPVPEEKRPKKPIDLKRRSRIMQIIAWCFALLVLVAALVYYNAFAHEKRLVNCPEFTLSTYESAAGNEEFTTEGGVKRTTLFYYWDIASEDADSAIETLENFYNANSMHYSFDVVAVHRYSSNLPDVAGYLNGKGYHSYNIRFAQDNKEQTYSAFGGKSGKPLLVAVNGENKISYNTSEKLTLESLESAVSIASCSVHYKVGDACPLFTLKGYNTESTAGDCSTVKNYGKVTVLNFWFTTCDPCKKELPEFEEVYKEYAGSINMYAIHIVNSTTPEEVQDFLNNRKDSAKNYWRSYTLGFVQDTEALMVSEALTGSDMCPTTVIITADGIIHSVSVKAMSKQELITAIEAAKE